MDIKKAKAAIYLDRTHPKKDMHCAIYIRVTFNRVRKYYPTGESLTITDFEKAISEKPGKKLEDTAHKIQDAKIEAQKIISSLSYFTFDLFEKKFISNKLSLHTLADIFDHAIKKLRSNDQIGTAVSYECAKNSIASFKPGLKLIDVSVSFLQSYEKWMFQNDKSPTTISIYLRHLRTLFNSAIEDGIISKDAYPFGKRKYVIPTGNNVKKALSIEDVGKIFNYKAKPGSSQDRAKNYWLFMYLCNGMNMKDMARLKYENLQDTVIDFKRAKTARTKRNAESIRVALTPEIDAIIKKFGNKNRHPANYIFPILTKKINAARERQLIQQITHVVNDNMKKIYTDLKLKHHVTTYTGRHSFATILQRSGVSTEFISEALGHSNLRTTQLYLKGFEDKKKMEVAKYLTSFNQENG